MSSQFWLANWFHVAPIPLLLGVGTEDCNIALTRIHNVKVGTAEGDEDNSFFQLDNFNGRFQIWTSFFNPVTEKNNLKNRTKTFFFLNLYIAPNVFLSEKTKFDKVSTTKRKKK